MPSPIAEQAADVLKSLDMWRLPVDPFEIAKHEGIILRPGSYTDGFDARIEFYKPFKKFCIFYNRPQGWRTEGRVRFTLGHELGHYYIDEHQLQLRAGKVHDSVSDYRSQNEIEKQADEFSADLLMPIELYRNEVNRFLGQYCTLDDLLKLANHLGTSITSTALRYCQSDHEPCTFFFSQDGVVRWGRYSTEMKIRGLSYFKSGTPPPKGSKTAKLWESIRTGEAAEPVAGVVDASVWFDRTFVRELWEEARPLGNTGRVITQITPHRRH